VRVTGRAGGRLASCGRWYVLTRRLYRNWRIAWRTAENTHRRLPGAVTNDFVLLPRRFRLGYGGFACGKSREIPSFLLSGVTHTFRLLRCPLRIMPNTETITTSGDWCVREGYSFSRTRSVRSSRVVSFLALLPFLGEFALDRRRR